MDPLSEPEAAMKSQDNDRGDKIMKRRHVKGRLLVALVIASALLGTQRAQATVEGVPGPVFYLTARDGFISTPDGDYIYVWGFASGAGPMQYPGPTLIVDQDADVTVNLTNLLSVPVSILFPGQTGVTTSGGAPGLLTQEAPPGGTVSYHFKATHPGTYQYHSGTRPELQLEMGLFGALIIRPPVANQAYEHPDSTYDREYLFVFSEMDPRIHRLVRFRCLHLVDNSIYFPNYFFINGRSSPDTMLPSFSPLLPHQPYNCLPRMHPGEKMLLRLVNADGELHPFHTHGNHMLAIARDGRLLTSPEGVGADLAESQFTITVPSGGTADAIFEWTGENLGWDIYGHLPGDDMEPNEYEPDHGKPFPVVLPDQKDLTFGPFYSGSPFLGGSGFLPPGEGAFNMNAGYFYMWHSHKEKEMLTYDVFPGGNMTMLIVEPPGAPIP
jgi:hypothetical protein